MPSKIEEFYARMNQGESQPEGRSLTSLITGEEPTPRQGLVGRFADIYDRFDQSWLPEDDYSKEQYVEQNWGLPGRMLGGANRAIRGVARGVTDALVGSPVRALGTAGTIASGGLTKLPQAARWGIAGLDAIDSARSGIRANEELQKGNYASAVGNALGAGVQGASVAIPVARRVSKVGPGYVPAPETPIVKPRVPEPEEMIPGVKPVRADVLAMELRGTNRAATRPVVRQTPEPVQRSLRLPRDFTDDAKARLAELDLPVDPGLIERYNTSPSFRSKIQELTGGPRPETPRVDVETELFQRGVTRPNPELVERVKADPKLLGKFQAPEVKLPKTHDEVLPKQGSLFAPDDLDDVKLEKVVANPNVSDDVKNVATRAHQALKKSSWFTTTKNSLGTSMEAELEKMDPVAKEIARQVKIASTDKPIRFNNYITGVRKEFEDMPQDKFEKVVDYLEGTNTSPTDDIKLLGDKMKSVLDRTGADLNEAGLLEKGTRQNYWPHRYENVPETTLRESMRAQGMTEDQIAANLQRIKDFREMKITGEYTRNDLNVPGYRKDKDVFIDHLRDVSNRVEDATRFGAKDINDPNSPISKLISQTSDPARVRDLMTRILRGDATSTDWQRGAAKAVRQYATMSQLSLSAISNFGGTLPVIVRSNAADAINGVGRAFSKELPDMKFMENTNLFRKFSGGFAESLNDNRTMYKLFGIEGSQNWLNRYAGAVGNSYAQTLFDGLKQNPANTKLMAQLEDLVLDKGNEVLKQDALTPKQLERAMVRMAEVTQGVMENRKLPYFWNKEGIATIPQIFMRTSFQTSKAMKDAIKMDPVRGTAKLIGGGLLIGEVIGDVKEAAKTGAQVGMNSIQQNLGNTKEDKNFVDEYKKNIGVSKDTDTTDRFSFTRQYLREIDPSLAENETVVRAMGNLEQSFALGMPADILRSLSDAMNETRGNPLAEAMNFFWVWDEGSQLARTAVKASQGNFRDVGREVVKRVPFVGRGAAREIDTTYQVKRAEKTGNTGSVVQGKAW